MSDDRQLAQALRQLAAATRSGHSLQQAFAVAAARGAGPVASACETAASQLSLGASVTRVTQRFAEQVGGHSAELFARVVAVQHRRGGDLGQLCHRLARILHERGRLQAEARSTTAQARFTANAVLGLPLMLALGLAWIAPGMVRQLASPAMALLALPSLVLMGVGIVVIRRLALGSLRLEPNPRATRGRPSVLLRLAGDGPPRQQALRAAAVGGSVALPLVLLSPTPLVLMLSAAAVAGAAAMPSLQERDRRGVLDDATTIALPHLLELSIALLAAGATPHEALAEGVAACPGELGERLRPAAAQVELGRSALSALLAVEAVQRSPELEAWAFALADGSRFGAPATDVLETLLRDARSHQRERFRQRAATAAPRIQLATVLLVVPAILWLMLLAAGGGLARQLQAAGVLA